MTAQTGAKKKLTKAEKRVINKATFKAARELEHPLVPISITPHAGQSVKYSSETFDLVCDRVAGGMTLRQACAELDICERTVRIWVLDDRGADHEKIPPVPGCSELMRRAMLLQAEAWADYLIELADGATEDTVQLARFRSDQRKWLMGKNNPRFRDKVAVGGDPDDPIKHQHLHAVVMSDALASIIGALDSAARSKSGGDGSTRLLDLASTPGPANP